MTTPTRSFRHPLLTTTRFVACAGLLAFAAHAAFGLGGSSADVVFDDYVYNGLVLMGAAWCISRAVLVRQERMAWALIGISLICWATAEIVNTVYLSKLEWPPYPSIADAFWLAFYPCSYTAMFLLVRGRVAQFRGSLWLDGIVAGLAVASVGVILVFQPVLQATDGRPIEIATDLAYPLGDLVMLAMVIGVFALTGWRPGRAWAFIGAGLMSMALADSIYAWQASKGVYVEGTVLDAMWPASTLLVGWAAWVPSGPKTRISLRGWRPLVLPTGFGLLGVGVLVYDHFEPVHTLAIVLAAGTMVMVLARTAVTFGENLTMLRNSQREALTDALTGLGNRRRLMNDLEEALETPGRDPDRALILFDLDGFKHYNDSFGHPAGDALLWRLGGALEAAVSTHGRAYRLGGDEFCALVHADAERAPAIVEVASAALTEHGQGFEVAASHGVVLLPAEARDAAAALQLADQRLYGNKGARRRSSIGQQTRDVLMQVLHEREPELHDHHAEVARLAAGVGQKMGMLPEDVDVMVRAAELHDVGKMAVPDEILQKPGPLDRRERDFIRKHTLVGERILAAAPALVPVARIVRTSHECWDGSGYPDGLHGDQIPLGARIIAVCDAFHAMTNDSVYQATVSREDALAELRRCAGTHFDPRVVEVFCAEMQAGRLPAAHLAGAERPIEFIPEPLPSALRDPHAERAYDG